MQIKTSKKHHFLLVGIWAALLLSICTGCHAKEETQEIETETEIKTTSQPSETLAVQETLIQTSVQTSTESPTTEETAEQEPSGSFRVTYQGQEAQNEIQLRHCDKIYDADEIRIYASFVYDLWVPTTFPYNQYVLYVQTPHEQTQLYPIADFLVDEERKALYTKIKGDDGFECVQCISLAKNDASMLTTQKELFNLQQAENMLCDSFNKAEHSFSNIVVELTEVKTGGAGLLSGETGGIEKATGQWYYADWEIDLSDNSKSVTPCILKQYHPDTDKELFAESSRIFDQIEQGDWSSVETVTDKNYRREGLDYLWGSNGGEWIRMDVNGDGLPELLNGWEAVGFDEDVKKIDITYIFAYEENAAKLVHIDINDGMEYLYITGNGTLVYEWSVSGGPCTNIQRLCRFDLKWNKEYLDTLVRYRFPEEDDDTSDDYREYYAETFPDTYGVGGAGVYYLRERPKTEKELADNEDGKYTVREYLTEEQFLNAYEKMTGWNFYASQYMY